MLMLLPVRLVLKLHHTVYEVETTANELKPSEFGVLHSTAMALSPFNTILLTTHKVIDDGVNSTIEIT